MSPVTPPALVAALLLPLAAPMVASGQQQLRRPAALAAEGTLVWPKPQQQIVGSIVGQAVTSGQSAFEFHATGSKSAILTSAFRRYRAICFPQARVQQQHPHRQGETTPHVLLAGLDVNVSSSTTELALSTPERYSLTVQFPRAVLSSQTVYGALRGLETFSQLLQDNLTIVEQSVVDWPRFPFRASMVDSSRHFLPIPLLKAHIDAMSYNKLNVLHWHIVDSNSFPYVSTTYPNLSAKGAYDSLHTYSTAEISDLVKYAQYRGVRCIPEFDTPSHTAPSWGRGGPPDLLTACGRAYGPLRPDLNQTYSFLEALLSEVASVFPDHTFHAGGDEVSYGCWAANPDIAAWLKERNMTTEGLNNYYMTRLFQIVQKSMRKEVMVWRPGAADHGVTPPKNIVFDVYSGLEQCPPDGQGCYNITASKTTAAGYRVVRSAGYYLDQLCDLDPDGRHHGNYWGYHVRNIRISTAILF
jgi:hexosaminidase